MRAGTWLWRCESKRSWARTQLNNDENLCQWWRGFFLIPGGTPRFHSNFTDKAGFLDHLSVKPRSKRLNFYGQTDVFGVFVRNRHFSGGPITDKESIFSDVSVNDSDFAKCSAAHHLLNHCIWVRLRAKRWFLRCARNLSQHFFGEGNRVEYFFNFGWFCSTFETTRTGFGVSGRQKSDISLGFCLLSDPRAPIWKCPVDKNHTFPPFFVYFQIRAPWISTSR